MKKIFLDTNILVDLIADRKPFSKYTIQLFQKAELNEIQLFTSSHSIATTHYLLKKYLGENELRVVIYDLLDYVTVISVDIDIIKKGLRSNHRDFEDSIQILCASTVPNIDCIVTRNTKDFKTSEIPAFNPDEIILRL
ncbi:MAG: PIN domain-containing protein [Saprospiraceae bacterium]|nr:PIN domain-containing protein [Saprospiraceae bacterium]MBP8085881.1 PIN domain-containing protein [Saprospiraceae bacterium]